ncbi:hypothetical protein DPMN_025229 [Dreissena polymorpha]|uniref:Uncharacterized protein n=1 Tax=Dreissena polymorpha TaxID=45954 RepID=A0A9D4LR78_DREPO|nr:hypothetical protein DPMN_025229 [Dreissena polymorpha]
MKCDFYSVYKFSSFFLPSDLVFDPARPNFELNQDFIGTKLLTKFHEDGTINVASRVFKNKCRLKDGQTTDKDQSQKFT